MPFINNPASVKFPEESNVNVVKWSNSPVAALTPEGYLEVDLVRWSGFAPQGIGGNAAAIPVNVSEWRGATPLGLNPQGHLKTELSRWRGDVPNDLVSGAVPANLIAWKGAAPNDLSGGNVPATDSRWAIKAPGTIALNYGEPVFAPNTTESTEVDAITSITEDIVLLAWNWYNTSIINNIADWPAQPMGCQIRSVVGTAKTLLFESPATGISATQSATPNGGTDINWLSFPFPVFVPAATTKITVQLHALWAYTDSENRNTNFQVNVMSCPVSSIQAF